MRGGEGEGMGLHPRASLPGCLLWRSWPLLVRWRQCCQPGHQSTASATSLQKPPLTPQPTPMIASLSASFQSSMNLSTVKVNSDLHIAKPKGDCVPDVCDVFMRVKTVSYSSFWNSLLMPSPPLPSACSQFLLASQRLARPLIVAMHWAFPHLMLYEATWPYVARHHCDDTQEDQPEEGKVFPSPFQRF